MNEQQAVSWLKQHERIVLVALVLIVALFIGNKWINHEADVTNKGAIIAEQQLEVTKQANAQIAQQVQTQTAQYQASMTVVTQQVASLSQQIAIRDAALSKQQQINTTLTAPQLAQRWQGSIGMGPADIISTPNGTLVSDAAAHATVNQLDQVPTLQADLKDQTNISVNLQTQNGKANDLITTLGTQVNGLHKQITDQDTACTKTLNDEKAKGRKSKRNWFIAGFLSGLGLRGAI